MYSSDNTSNFNSDYKLSLDKNNSGIRSFFSNVKKKISNFFFINEDDGKEGIYIINLENLNILPSYINENEHIYDAPSLNHYECQIDDSAKKNENVQLTNNNLEYSDKLGRRLSTDSSKTIGTKKKVNSMIKIMNFITNKKFIDKRKPQDTSSSYSNRHTAFKFMNNSYKNISFNANKIINYNDLFEVANDKNVIKPIALRKGQNDDNRSINKKRGRNEEKDELEINSQNHKKRKCVTEDNQSIFSSVNNLNKYKNYQREDVSMNSINSVLASQKANEKKKIINDDVSMNIRTDNKSIFVTKSYKSKTLDDIKKEIQEKRSTNRKMIEEISKRSSRKTDFHSQEFDYEERKKYLNNYYQEKEKASKDNQNMPQISLKPSFPISTFELSKDRNFSLTKSSISIPSTSSNKKVPVVLIEKKDQMEIYPVNRNKTCTTSVDSKPIEKEEKKEFSLFNLNTKAESKTENKPNLFPFSNGNTSTEKNGNGLMLNKKEIEPLENKKINQMTDKNDSLFKDSIKINQIPVNNEKIKEADQNKTPSLFTPSVFSNVSNSNTNLAISSVNSVQANTVSRAPQPVLFGDNSKLIFGNKTPENLTEKEVTPEKTFTDKQISPLFKEEKKRSDSVTPNKEIKEQTPNPINISDKVEVKEKEKERIINPNQLFNISENKLLQTPYPSMEVKSSETLPINKLETKSLFTNNGLFSLSNSNTADQSKLNQFTKKEEKKDSSFGSLSSTNQFLSQNQFAPSNKVLGNPTPTITTNIVKPENANLINTSLNSKDQSSSSLFNPSNPFIKASNTPSLQNMNTLGYKTAEGKTENLFFNNPNIVLGKLNNNTPMMNNDNDMAISPITSPKQIPKSKDIPPINNNLFSSGTNFPSFNQGIQTPGLFPPKSIVSSSNLNQQSHTIVNPITSNNMGLFQNANTNANGIFGSQPPNLFGSSTNNQNFQNKLSNNPNTLTFNIGKK